MDGVETNKNKKREKIWEWYWAGYLNGLRKVVREDFDRKYNAILELNDEELKEIVEEYEG